MQIINKGLFYLEKFWIASYENNVDYRMLKYITKVNCLDGVLLHNNISGETLLLSNYESDVLFNQPEHILDIVKMLVQKHFLIPRNSDEKKIVDQLRSFLQSIKDKRSINHYHIMPTSNCNARCFYCYESDIPRINMTSGTIAKLSDYIESHCNEEKSITLDWFGGEPTLCANSITQICSDLRAKGIKYKSFIITNGYLFNDITVEKAKNIWNLKQVQITLDGTKDTYNKVKSYVYFDKNPYETVMNNIKCLLENEIKVVLRLNLDCHNENQLEELIEEITTRFGENSSLNVYVSIIHSNLGYTPLKHNNGDYSRLESKWKRLQDILKNKKLQKINYSLPKIEIFSCMAGDDTTLLVTPDGKFAKCEHLIYDSVVGSLDKASLENEKINEWKKIKENDKCNKCYFYPNCYVLSKCPITRPCTAESLKRGMERNCVAVLNSYLIWKNK